MRVAVLAMGSRGDVEPFLALAAGLRRRGHTVVVATHAEFAALVTGAGVEFAELGGNPREALRSPQGPTSSSGVAGSPPWPRAPRRYPGNGSPTRGSPTPSPTPSAVATGPDASRRRWRRKTASPRPSTCSKPSYDGTARAAATACAL